MSVRISTRPCADLTDVILTDEGWEEKRVGREKQKSLLQTYI